MTNLEYTDRYYFSSTLQFLNFVIENFSVADIYHEVKIENHGHGSEFILEKSQVLVSPNEERKIMSRYIQFWQKKNFFLNVARYDFLLFDTCVINYYD